MTPMRILVVNPNTTLSMTDKIGAAARVAASPGTEVTAISPAMGPVSIEGYYDEAGKRKPRNARASVRDSALGQGGGGSAAPTRLRGAAQRNGFAWAGLDCGLVRGLRCLDNCPTCSIG